LTLSRTTTTSAMRRMCLRIMVLYAVLGTAALWHTYADVLTEVLVRISRFPGSFAKPVMRTPTAPLRAPCTSATPCPIAVEVLGFIGGEDFRYEDKVTCYPDLECRWCSSGRCPRDRVADAHVYDWGATLVPYAWPPSEHTVTVAATMESGRFALMGPVHTAVRRFDVTMSVDPASDVPLAYWPYGDQLPFLGSDPTPTLQGRLPVAAFVATNCEERRRRLVESLIRAGLPVHALGTCVPKGAEPRLIPPVGNRMAAKHDALLRYSLSLAIRELRRPRVRH
jgi:hypothetical protein